MSVPQQSPFAVQAPPLGMQQKPDTQVLLQQRDDSPGLQGVVAAAQQTGPASSAAWTQAPPATLVSRQHVPFFSHGKPLGTQAAHVPLTQ
jgi:hypothetical protein